MRKIDQISFLLNSIWMYSIHIENHNDPKILIFSEVLAELFHIYCFLQNTFSLTDPSNKKIYFRCSFTPNDTQAHLKSIWWFLDSWNISIYNWISGTRTYVSNSTTICSKITKFVMDTNIYHRMLGKQSFVHLYAMEPFIEVENYMHHYGIATFPKIEMSFPSFYFGLQHAPFIFQPWVLFPFFEINYVPCRLCKYTLQMRQKITRLLAMILCS